MEMMNTISKCLNIPKDKGLMPSSILRFILKEKLKSKTKLKTLKQSYEEMKRLLGVVKTYRFASGNTKRKLKRIAKE